MKKLGRQPIIKALEKQLATNILSKEKNDTDACANWGDDKKKNDIEKEEEKIPKSYWTKFSIGTTISH